MNVAWAPRAMQRATEIARHIARDNPAAARKWVTSIFDKADAIPPFPGRCTSVSESNRPDIRQVFLGDYRIIFRFSADLVEVLTVRHGAQRLKQGDIPPAEDEP